MKLRDLLVLAMLCGLAVCAAFYLVARAVLAAVQESLI